MGKDTRISYPDHTFNIWWGCTEIASGCARCYARRWATEVGYDVWGADRGRRLDFTEGHWQAPRQWEKAAVKTGKNALVLCGSMCDIFEIHPDAAVHQAMQEARARLWTLIEETACMAWLLLTKRPHNWTALVPFGWRGGWPTNTWLGVSISDQTDASKAGPMFRTIPAVTKVISYEPVLGSVQWSSLQRSSGTQLGGILAGGETGPGARPWHIDWVRAARDWCHDHGLSFHYKAHGDWLHQSQLSGMMGYQASTEALRQFACHTWQDGTRSYRVGRSQSGRILDGVVHDDRPEIDLVPRQVRMF